MTENTTSQSKLLRFIITYVLVMSGLAIAFTNSKPTLRFPNISAEVWRVAPNHEYVVGMGEHPFRYAHPYVITEDSVVLLSNENNLQFDDIYISPNSEVIATTQMQKVDFIRPDGQFLKQVDLSNDITNIDHASWSIDSESLIVLGIDRTPCRENPEPCEVIKLFHIFLNDNRIIRIDAPMCNIPQQPECLHSHSRGQLYWRLDGTAFYLVAETRGPSQAYWYRIPIDAPEEIELIQPAGYYLLETYQYFPEQVFAGEWNTRHTRGNLPFQLPMFTRESHVLTFKLEGNNYVVVAGLLLSVAALYFGAIKAAGLFSEP